MAGHVNVEHRAAPFTGRLFHGRRNFVGFGVADADLPLAVADDDHGGEAEPPAALHHARAAADLDQLVDQVATAPIAALAASLAAIAAASTTPFVIAALTAIVA